jgi:hypothetical protein
MKTISIEYDGNKEKFIIKCDGLEDLVLKSSLGAKCLYHLINNPDRSFKPAILRDIIKSSVEVPGEIRRCFEITSNDDQLFYQAMSSYIPACDMKTVIECRKRLKQINLELAEANFNNDLKGADNLIAEKDEIESYLQDSLNINGTFRNLNKEPRKATRAIQRNLNHVLEEISQRAPDLYNLLDSRLLITSQEVKYFISNKSYFL